MPGRVFMGKYGCVDTKVICKDKMKYERVCRDILGYYRILQDIAIIILQQDTDTK
jgi:hypothetical protein